MAEDRLLSPRWRYVADTVMGGVSQGQVRMDVVQGHDAMRLTGRVSTENNGGFLQAAMSLTPDDTMLDASAWTGLRMAVTGNGEAYNLHLRTADLTRPWQSYRATFQTTDSWQTITLPFDDFVPYRVEAPLKVWALRRLGIVAIGRDFEADVAVRDLRLYSS